MYNRLFVTTLAITLAGCAASGPSKPPAAPPTVSSETGEMGVNLDVSLASLGSGGGRTVQFAGGNGSVGSYNDIAKLVVGVFDEGSTTGPALGYKYTSAFGSTLTSANVATIAGSTWLTDLGSRVDAVSTADFSDARRYVVREYTSNLAGLTAISVAFSKLPRASQHTYVSLAAAYDADGNNIGFTSGSIASASITANSNFAASALTLTLNSNLFNATLTQAATISNVYPEAL